MNPNISPNINLISVLSILSKNMKAELRSEINDIKSMLDRNQEQIRMLQEEVDRLKEKYEVKQENSTEIVLGRDRDKEWEMLADYFGGQEREQLCDLDIRGVHTRPV